jgi:hypothetical protein
LKTIGVTRTTATFLFVVGFISLAGSGSAISSLISDRQPGEPIFSLLLRQLITYGQMNVHGPWRVLILVLLAPTIVATIFFGLLALYVFLLFVDRLVKKFDPSWHSSRGERRDPRRSPLQDQFSKLSSQLTGLPSLFGTFRSFDVERKHYTKLLASFPYILIGGVIFFLFSGVAFYDSDGKITVNLTTTFIGVTIILVATAFWVVYITKVIEPRWEKAVEKANENNSAPGQLWVNRELAALLLLLVLALGLAALLPTSGRGTYFTISQYKHIVWGFVALFMAFGSLGLAYGVIQRGIFKDVDFLTKRRDSYRYWIERYSARPTIEDASDYLDDVNETPISAYLDNRSELYRNQLSYELNEIFGDDFEDQQPPRAIQNLWRRLGFNGKSNRPTIAIRLKSSPATEPRLIDYSIAPEATRSFISSRSEIARIEQRKSDIGQEIRQLENELNGLAVELMQLRILLEHCRHELATATEISNRERSSLMEGREKEMMKFRSEFAIGSICRNILDDEPGPVPRVGEADITSPGNIDSGASAAQVTSKSVLV